MDEFKFSDAIDLLLYIRQRALFVQSASHADIGADFNGNEVYLLFALFQKSFVIRHFLFNHA